MAYATGLDIKIGLHRRLAPSLVQDFYPDGMPEDWRNNFLVMLTQAIWVRGDDADLSDVLAAIVGAPKPVLTVWEAAAESSKARQDWQCAYPEQSLIVLSPDAPIWSPDNGVVGARVGLIPASDQPALLRIWLEAFAAQAPAHMCAVFIEGDNPSVATLDRVQTLLELLGW
ncbi:MAG TPA: hypothetical protein PLD79_05255 [Halothiobacillus sp.]|nr:MAG: hypothetical protein B7Z82_06130 [Halothiobacillus sp. 20-54-6]HQT43383.1 hypothetical protein [Halothiobacillus sp.]